MPWPDGDDSVTRPWPDRDKTVTRPRQDTVKAKTKIPESWVGPDTNPDTKGLEINREERQDNTGMGWKHQQWEVWWILRHMWILEGPREKEKKTLGDEGHLNDFFTRSN